eukprot:TRINITY_DN15878_c0_g1_i1.p1 TRINITY_DN15878_c0_g1~~TRINITY_DN15878_c0_g1_i1.p1  ORF type:complete len:181 (-),score=22.75 TRINITY_DN15878_c0_g1_i1:166-708(-)
MVFDPELIGSCFRECISLRSIKDLILSSEPSFQEELHRDALPLIKPCLLALAFTRVGLNFEVSEEISRSLPPQHGLALLTMKDFVNPTLLPLATFIEDLQRTAKLEVPIATSAIIEYLRLITRADTFDLALYEESLEFIASGRCPLLPSLDALQNELRSAALLCARRFANRRQIACRFAL